MTCLSDNFNSISAVGQFCLLLGAVVVVVVVVIAKACDGKWCEEKWRESLQTKRDNCRTTRNF